MAILDKKRLKDHYPFARFAKIDEPLADGENWSKNEEFQKAAEASGEKVWPLPLWDEYCDDIKSKIADVKNLGAPRQAGTIAGGAFLKEFVGETPWAHVDIAAQFGGVAQLVRAAES